MWTYPATVTRVIDADTFELAIDLGFYVTIRQRIRLLGLDCPELSTPEGHAARQYAEHLLPLGAPVTIKSEKDRRSFDRWVASVSLKDGRDVATLLREAGYEKRTDPR